jgi:hypothetical protein
VSRVRCHGWIETFCTGAEPKLKLFGPEALLAIRAVGPAIPLDMIRYMRRRQAEHVGMAEAIAMFLLPQIEGIETQMTRASWLAPR